MRGIFSVQFDKSPLPPLFQRGNRSMGAGERNSWNEQPLKRKILKIKSQNQCGALRFEFVFGQQCGLAACAYSWGLKILAEPHCAAIIIIIRRSGA
jgi:hypothetical protein